MRYGFDCGIWGNLFGVPTIIADNFLKIADSSQLKVLLYLLRNNGKTFEISEIANALDISEDAVCDSLLFWQQYNILPSDETGTMSEVNSIFSAPPAEKYEYIPENQNSSYLRNSSEGLNITPSEIADMIKETPKLNELLVTAQKYFENFNFATQRSLVWIYQYLGLPAEVIIMILEYCSSLKRLYIWEIEAIAVDFRKNGIDTPKLAEVAIEHMRDYSENNSFITRIKRMFDMQRAPVTKQRKYIMNWKSENYPYELIQLAYDKAVEKTGNNARIPIEYIDTILKRWKEKNISTVEEAEKDDLDFKNVFGKKKKKKADENAFCDMNHFEEDYEIFINNF